ncbi:MAG: hypothetical protein QOG99_1241 [Frankiales bacterium]|nr:hypothetical protein [Frankiales bacterium]
MRRFATELMLGMRMTLGGGRSGLVRAVLTALGVGLGVACLLFAASIPSMMQAHSARSDARDVVSYSGPTVQRSDSTILIGLVDTGWRDQGIRGQLLQPEGPHAPVPPGLTALPAPGQLVVSPALHRLLDSPSAALLRQRLSGPIVGEIGSAGLTGPSELAFYAGSDSLTVDQGTVVRREHFGTPSGTSQPLSPVLLLLVVIIFVVLLLPVGIFVAAAVRFGGESRDRRLAGIRLVGADAGMARRIAAGEALLSGLLGLVAGVGFFLLGRALAPQFVLFNLSVFSSDVTPSAGMAVLIAIGVPAVAVAITLLSLRRVVIEPLGVTRRGPDAKRRLWWRLAMPVVGVVLLLPLIGQVSDRSGINTTQVVAGVLLLLIGVATLLPWLVQATVRRLGGGPVSWQLAVRRLQLDGTTSARAVTGIAVAVAGTIGLQMLFSSVQANNTHVTGQDTRRAQIYVSVPSPNGWADQTAVESGLRSTLGVTSALTNTTLTVSSAKDDNAMTSMTVGNCAMLEQLATLTNCRDGDVYIVKGTDPGALVLQPGATLKLGGLPSPPLGPDGQPTGPAVDNRPLWTVSDATQVVDGRPDPLDGNPRDGLLVTPAAAPSVALHQADLSLYIRVDPTVPDVLDRVRNAIWAINPLGNISRFLVTVQTDRFAQIQRGLSIGAVVILLLIGASLLVTVLEQLRDRRRLLAILVAFGTRRSTIAWSILWQAAVPILLGLTLAVIAGITLGAVLLQMVSESVRIDWTMVGSVAGIAAGVVLLVTAASMPALWRLMRADGLRTE